ncbi:hypothetical protein CJF42_12780 [Pseudoalteromonas sp. NBT06-2]|uniref:hypothetical protein n=1 Tax=Pseudoalteromonas sp. NBT06-2 TaxID=2025950 RepID=UPI000BA794A6|nr:hypothetical protein [Pseudoalteromonas sp. NBT06-2]PAJ74018.1 hypothetical protein CJF42_12780 [Pseudoalteromonas sp. NBT06-2]
MLVALDQVSSSSEQFGFLLLLNAGIVSSVFLLSKISYIKLLINKDVKVITLLISGFFTGTSILALVATDLLSLIWGIEGIILLYLGFHFNFYSVRIEAYLLLLISVLTATVKVDFLHWLLLLVPVITSGFYIGNFHFKAQILIGQIARIEAFLTLWLIAYFYRTFFKTSRFFKIAQHLDTAFFIILPICFLPAVYRQSPEFITLALWEQFLFSIRTNALSYG